MTESPHQGPTPLAITLSNRISTYEFGGGGVIRIFKPSIYKSKIFNNTKKGRPRIEKDLRQQYNFVWESRFLYMQQPISFIWE